MSSSETQRRKEEKNYVAIHVVTTMDVCGYKHHHLVENKQEGMLVVAKLEEAVFIATSIIAR